MQQVNKTSTRKKFLLWSAAILSSVTALKFITAPARKKNGAGKTTVKMLTRDGKLVEIDKELLMSSGNKVTNEELQNWVKK